ncbi:spore coat protein [Ornithinibacillus sp. BX22]|uniref:Spore coat protein n=2 Tax=Ornithinibacillus TaxID=484508 RepID=A0A923L8E4_9BACI|nr:MULTISPECIES: spore coat protein [Ornithinibacillus]MBC5638309.1 spore coat protein [Ornithinibacillus hominis]MBS3680911.1 spore coat protein [Ornithinibacillus massiliensis]
MPKTTGVHETLELHELLTFKNLCLTKSTAMNALAQDDELKQLLTQTTQMDRQSIQTLQGFLS